MKKKNRMLKLPIYFDWANEIIYHSLIVIIFGLAYLFAFNLLRFNWYSVFFAILTLLLIYFKRASYLIINAHCVKVIYFHFYQAFALDIQQIECCIFYEANRRVEIKLLKGDIISLYLSERSKELLLEELVQYYPHISSIHIERK